MQHLTAEQVEDAFVETARRQENGEAFDWPLLTTLINQKLVGEREASRLHHPAISFQQ